MPIYMNWGDTTPPTIRGDVDEADHRGWIELESVQYGKTKTVHTDESRYPDPPTVKLSELVVTKVQDVASAKLFRESLQGTPTKVRIDFVKDDHGKPQVYLSLLLENAQISAFSLAADTGKKPMERLSIVPESVQYGPAKGVQPHSDSWYDVGGS